MAETLREGLKHINLNALAIGYYRIQTSLESAINVSEPEITGPYPSKKLATPLWQRMGARIYFPLTRVEFHIFKPKGAIKPDQSELAKIE